MSTSNPELRADRCVQRLLTTPIPNRTPPVATAETGSAASTLRHAVALGGGALRDRQAREADAKAAAIYAAAYNATPEAAPFYQFMRTMESYPSVLKGSTLILSTDSELLRFLKTTTPSNPGQPTSTPLPKPAAPPPAPPVPAPAS